MPEVASNAFSKCGKKAVLNIPNTEVWKDAIKK